MKTFVIGKAYDPSSLSDELLAASVPSSIRSDGVIVTDDTAVDATVNAVIVAHDPVTSAVKSLRTAAVAILSDPNATAKALRGLVDVLMDEINLLRQRDVDRAADVAAATSLANLQTRWASRAALAQRTVAQAKTAIVNHINAGDAD